MVGLLPPASSGSVKLERPQKVGSVLEVGPNSEDLVDQVFNTDDVELAQTLLDYVVGRNGSAVSVHLEFITY